MDRNPRLRVESPFGAEKPGEGGQVQLRLYIAGLTPNSRRAVANLEAARADFAASSKFRVEYIDVLVETSRASIDSVIMTPTLVAIGAKSRLVIIGDLGDAGKLKAFLSTAASFE
jgi:hypothetical protein